MTMPAREPPATTESRSTGILVAWILCWISGIICIDNPLNDALDALGVPGLQGDKPDTIIGYAIGYASLAVTYFVAGSLIHKRRITGGWIGVGTAAVVAGIQVVGLTTDTENTLNTTALLALNLAILVLLAFSWRRLDRLQPPAGEQTPPGVSTPSKVILGFCIAAALALVSPIGWFILMYAGYFALVFSLLFAYAVLWALIDLVRFASLRTVVNIGIALLGLVAVMIAIWGSYQLSVHPSRDVL